jgi:hypothetical protein
VIPRIVGLQVMGVLLISGYSFHFDDSQSQGNDISDFKFYDGIANNLLHYRKEVYTDAAEARFAISMVLRTHVFWIQVVGLILSKDAMEGHPLHQLLKDRVRTYIYINNLIFG